MAAAPSNPSVIALDKAALSKTVQQMSIDGDHPSQTYVVKDLKFGPLETSPPLAPIPIIDISCFLSPTTRSRSKLEQQETELAKLRSALATWGCFEAVNHGISSSFKGFFSFQLKRKVNVPGNRALLRVMGMIKLSLRTKCLIGVIAFRSESFLKTKEIQVFGLKILQVSEEYGSKIRFVTDVMFKAIAKSLRLEEDCFSRVFIEDGAIMQGRFILYPSCPTPNLVYGLKPHTDRSGVTVLLQDVDVEGLQVLSNDKWFMVPLIRDSLFVNLDDQLQIMSNGIYKSPMHRVVTNVEKGKISIAMFNEPNPSKEIEPMEALIDEDQPRRYKNVKNYGFFNYECFQKGIVAIDAAKIYLFQEVCKMFVVS